MQYEFVQDTVEFLSWQSYGLREINKRWQDIIKKTTTGLEAEYKIALIEAEDFLYQILEERGYEGDTFEEMVKNARQKMSLDFKEILLGHTIRNAIVYDPDYRLDNEKARQLLVMYERAIKNMALV